MKVPFFDLHRQYTKLSAELVVAFHHVCETTAFTGGVEVERFEHEFAAYCGAAHCVGVNSGTSALHLALIAAGVGPGDEVITPTLTFVATVAAIIQCGATPVLVDCTADTLTLDPTLAAHAITPRTKVILPVHLHGRLADMEGINTVAREAGVKVIEDASQAHGAILGDRRAGSFGLAGCFSFYPSKNLGACGDAGAVVTDDEYLAERVRRLRNWGMVKNGQHLDAGFNFRLASLQAAALHVKMPRLDSWNAARRAIARAYDDAFRPLGITLPSANPQETHSYYVYAVRTPHRDRLRSWLEGRGIGTHIHYAAPVHLQPAYRRPEYPAGSFPVSELASKQLLSLPMFPELQPTEIEIVCREVHSYFRSES